MVYCARAAERTVRSTRPDHIFRRKCDGSARPPSQPPPLNLPPSSILQHRVAAETHRQIINVPMGGPLSPSISPSLFFYLCVQGVAESTANDGSFCKNEREIWSILFSCEVQFLESFSVYIRRAHTRLDNSFSSINGKFQVKRRVFTCGLDFEKVTYVLDEHLNWIFSRAKFRSGTFLC